MPSRPPDESAGGGASHPADKRRDLRYGVGGRGTFATGPQRPAARIQLSDISRGGASFRTDRALARGAAGEIEFTVLCDGTPIAVRAPAIVRYCVLDRAEFRVGVEFSGIDDAARTSIETIVDFRRQVIEGR